jgi:hypothetical protein
MCPFLSHEPNPFTAAPHALPCLYILQALHRLRVACFLAGASIAIDDCYELWESGFISIPYNFQVKDLRPELRKLLAAANGTGPSGDADPLTSTEPCDSGGLHSSSTEPEPTLSYTGTASSAPAGVGASGVGSTAARHSAETGGTLPQNGTQFGNDVSLGPRSGKASRLSNSGHLSVKGSLVLQAGLSGRPSLLASPAGRGADCSRQLRMMHHQGHSLSGPSAKNSFMGVGRLSAVQTAACYSFQRRTFIH